ncbi:hypothetical protein EDF54_1009 [Rathayibacter sp. PhB93]|uniref:hypothetical protein n=1 Tax=unclassified Rathayibacter TaxID=2609250 RepID=UPI000F462B61|nr:MULTISPECIES: hypothetical protein [unclassified Rathayibacter]ROQ16129.1 hypothetical protein EDF54_1009 [Rathayibacter sp. PhB93]TDQ16070.1 hypothetical protein EDF17_0754 [Rathayibacter sp. PhB1]
MSTPSTGTLALPTTDQAAADPAAAAPPAPPAPAALSDDEVLRPADLVTALTGVALGFFALFVHGLTQWSYVGPTVERAGVLGWLAPALVGLICVLTAVTSVAVRAARRESRRGPSAPTGAAS